MTRDLWIIVPGWDRFQHYKDRNPPWIKVYARLQADPNWLGLTQSAQGLLLNIWLAYSSTNGRVTVEKLRRITSEPWQTRNLDALNRAGFIEFSASEPLAARKHLSTETETETRPYIPRSGTTPRDRKENPRALGTNPRAVAKRTLPRRNAERWIANGLAKEIPTERLAEVISDEFGIRDPDLLDELVTKARAL